MNMYIVQLWICIYILSSWGQEISVYTIRSFLWGKFTNFTTIKARTSENSSGNIVKLSASFIRRSFDVPHALKTQESRSKFVLTKLLSRLADEKNDVRNRPHINVRIIKAYILGLHWSPTRIIYTPKRRDKIQKITCTTYKNH